MIDHLDIRSTIVHRDSPQVSALQCYFSFFYKTFQKPPLPDIITYVSTMFEG